MPFRHVFLTLIGAFGIALVGFYSSSVHVPFLMNFLVSVGLGWIQPKKGWILALLQIVLIGVYYLLISQLSWEIDALKIARFTSLLAFFPTLTGSFMGGFVRRAF